MLLLFDDRSLNPNIAPGMPRSRVPQRGGKCMSRADIWNRHALIVRSSQPIARVPGTSAKKI
jgi:hypothetical protein